MDCADARCLKDLRDGKDLKLRWERAQCVG
jgi:hypothetical protein